MESQTNTNSTNSTKILNTHDSRHGIKSKKQQSLKKTKSKNIFASFRGYIKYKELTLMFLPVALYFIIFKYIPMYGITMAFKDYKIKYGILGSPWIGLQNFRDLFELASFSRAIRNTIIISLLKLVTGFPCPIILALLLNEVRHLKFKKTVQTISYLPHFLSWIILAGIFYQFLSPSTGMVNYILSQFGIKPIYFMGSNEWFRFTLVVTNIWKGIGWSSIIYLAAIAGIDLNLYEAAVCDGANRFQRMWSITIPSILPTITVLLILDVGGIMSAGFDQIFNLYNPAVYETADIIDTYVYRMGIGEMKYSMATAVGLFQNVIGFFLVITTNFISKKISNYGIW